MISAALLAYAVAVALATRLLRRGWAARTPWVTIGLWQIALVTIVASTVLGLLALGVPTAAGGLAGLLQTCATALERAYRVPLDGTAGLLLGIGLAFGITARAVLCLLRELWRARRQRRRHEEALVLLGSIDRRLGVTLVEHDAPGAYCMPGGAGRIVLTTAAVSRLDAQQLAGVLAHERAHLAGRHDLVLAGARALARAFPLPVFTTAVAELTTLVEMLADDAVRGRDQRRRLAEALVELGVSPATAPAGALPAAGSATAIRVRRLVAPHRILPGGVAVSLLGGAAVAALVPAVIAVAPVVAAVGLPFCPIWTG